MIVGVTPYDGKQEGEIDRILQYMRWIDNHDWIPVAMECINESHQVTNDELIRLIRDIERRAYGFFVIRPARDTRISHWASVLREITQGIDLLNQNSKLQLDREEKMQMKNALNDLIPRIARRPLLLRLDSMNLDAGAKYDRKIITVEHVLPENPPKDSTWLKAFPDEETRAEWTNRIANLLLLSIRKNSRASNFDFERKKRVYFKKGNMAPFAITSEVLNESEWTLETIGKRQDRLMAKFEHEWRLN